MAVYEIPLLAAPQSFDLTLAGRIYQVRLLWQDAVEGGWFLDLSDDQGTALLSGHPLVTGADLLEQYAHLQLGIDLRVMTSGDLTAYPTFTNLGEGCRLYMVTP